MAHAYRPWEGAEAAASRLFDKALFMRVEHNGPSIAEMAAFRVLPSVVAAPGIGMEKLMDLESKRLGVGMEDLAAYHVIDAVGFLIRAGFVYSSKDKDGNQQVFPTTKSSGLFYLLEDPERLSAWMKERRSKAQGEGMELFKFDSNADKVSKLIEGMVSSKNGVLKEAARQ